MKTSALQTARTRLRSRNRHPGGQTTAPIVADEAESANDNRDLSNAWREEDAPLLALMHDAGDEVSEAEAYEEVFAEPPLTALLADMPDEIEDDGDDVFVLGSPPDLPPVPLLNAVEDEADKVVVAFTSSDPPFDPPDAVADEAAFVEEDADAPPFDPPDESELDTAYQCESEVESIAAPPNADTDEVSTDDEETQFVEASAPVALPSPREPLILGDTPRLVAGEPWRALAPAAGKPAPPIIVHAAWDRPESGEVMDAFAADKRMARATVRVQRGGVEAAVGSASRGEPPDLVLVDSTHGGAQLLNGLDRLRAVAPDAQVIVIGATNDITLLRELAARGVSQYLVAPTRAEQLLRVVCGLYEDFDRSKTIAVIGARGGLGASSIAYNIAWSIAERQRARTALVDLDVAFGAHGLTPNGASACSFASVLNAADDEDAFDAATLERGERLRIMPSPAQLDGGPEFGIAAVERVMRCARRASPYVVLDLPHMWSSWISHVLERADEVVIVSSPDLASLRNTENFLRALDGARPGRNPPCVILSQTGVPKRPEISLKDFSGSVRSPPVASVPYEPTLFGAAAIGDCALAEVDAEAKAAKIIEEVSWALTGRDPDIESRVRVAPEVPALTRAMLEPIKIEAAPAQMVRPVSSEAAVDLAQEAPKLYADYVAKARQAMQAELATLHKPRKRSGGFGLRILSLAACLIGVAWVGGAWRLDGMATATAQPQSAAAATPAAVVPPDAAVDPELTRLTTLAESGDADAQHRLAQVYERGLGVGRDIARARAWTERAAAAGEPRAMHDLGVYFARGEGGAQDDAAAFRWFRQAAEIGVADSQYNLGVLYERGRGVEANAPEALFWFMLAAEQGDASATARVSAAEAALPPFELEQARVRAQAFATRFAAPAQATVEQTSLHAN